MNTHNNPLSDSIPLGKLPESCILVIFGATGDLTARKLLPALYNLAVEGQLPAHFACVGFARRDKTNEDFRTEMLEAVNRFSRSKPVDPKVWNAFQEQLYYHRAEFDQDDGYESLNTLLNQLDKDLGTKGNRVFYLSVQPSYFPVIVEKLSEHNLIYASTQSHEKWSRIIIEKPFGHDFNSALALQHELTQYLDENQIYRIDHYLGKETVQNLLVFRFGNALFESLWNRDHIDHIQLTVAEDQGIGTRGRFWEEAGMLRDIVQNHLMQLLTLVAMEPPASLSSTDIRQEKVKVLDSIRTISSNDAVRGQYSPGIIEGEPVRGYRQEENVSPQSNVETYMALKIEIDNWRWAGVPFYLRAGKRLPKKVTEIAITFKKIPELLFKNQNRSLEPNVLIVRIQPDEGISLKMNCKIPGLGTVIQPVKMDFRYGSYFGATPPDAYERLICDCMAGDRTLFASDQEVMLAWKLLTPILEFWSSHLPADFPNYPCGLWGPPSADLLLQRDGRQWRLL